MYVIKQFLIQNLLQAVDAIDNLKLKTIKEFDKWLARLIVGYKDNYDFILHEISFIQSYDGLDNADRLYEFLMSN